MKLINLDEAIDAIESTDWYHLFNGKLSEGAEDEDHALYKADDVYNAIKGVPVVDAVPVDFIIDWIADSPYKDFVYDANRMIMAWYDEQRKDDETD